MTRLFASAKLASVAAALLLYLAALPAFSQSEWYREAQALPTPTGPVNDFVGVMDQATKDRLNKRLIDYQRSTGVELAVAVVDTTGDRDIFDYSLGLARGWGIGSKGDDNPSALLLVAINDRKYFTQVSRDLEDELPDGVAGSLQRQNLVPDRREFKEHSGIRIVAVFFLAFGFVVGGDDLAFAVAEQIAGAFFVELPVQIAGDRVNDGAVARDL